MLGDELVMSDVHKELLLLENFKVVRVEARQRLDKRKRNWIICLYWKWRIVM